MCSRSASPTAEIRARAASSSSQQEEPEGARRSRGLELEQALDELEVVLDPVVELAHIGVVALELLLGSPGIGEDEEAGQDEYLAVLLESIDRRECDEPLEEVRDADDAFRSEGYGKEEHREAEADPPRGEDDAKRQQREVEAGGGKVERDD
jgi:hypothetical protein